jgi:hypothetical protein
MSTSILNKFILKVEVFDALATAMDQRVLGEYRFSQSFLQKVGFI